MFFKKCFYFGCFIINFLMIDGDNISENEDYNKRLGSQLIKNLTDVNKTLKDLINNYKYLEKIYRADETLQSDLSGSEIDEGFKQMKNKLKERQRSHKEISNTISTSTFYEGTAHIYESRTSDELQSGDTKGVNENIANSQDKDSKTELEVSSEKIKSGFESKSGSEEEDISEDVKEIEIEMQQESSEKVHKKSKPKRVKNIFGKKTRFNVLHTGQQDFIHRSNKSEIPLKVGNQRIVYSEKFSPQTIWHDIKNRPIKLNRVMSSEETPILRNNDEVKLEDMSDNTKKKDGTSQESVTNYNQTSNNATEIVPPLRSYGDACLEMPIKKCKKALKTVNKSVCKMRFKCKSELKSDFEANYKRGCEKQYIYNVEKSVEDTTITTQKNDYPDFQRDLNEDENIIREKNDKNKMYADIEKNVHQSTKTPFIITLGNEIRKSSSHSLSLRNDKYEKKCQKELRAKCIGAGDYAVKKTCSKHKCEEKLKKALEKACKKECKNTFVIDKKSSDSSDDSSESDSDSDK